MSPCAECEPLVVELVARAQEAERSLAIQCDRLAALAAVTSSLEARLTALQGALALCRGGCA